MGLRNAGKVLCQEVDFDIETLNLTFGTSGRRCSQSPLDGRLATTIVDRYFRRYFAKLSQAACSPSCADL